MAKFAPISFCTHFTQKSNKSFLNNFKEKKEIINIFHYGELRDLLNFRGKFEINNDTLLLIRELNKEADSELVNPENHEYYYNVTYDGFIQSKFEFDNSLITLGKYHVLFISDFDSLSRSVIKPEHIRKKYR